MKIEVTTKVRFLKGGESSELILRVNFLPRGSGNRNKAKRLADAFREHESMKQHIRKVVCGASSVTVHMLNSYDLAMDLIGLQVDKWIEQRAQVDGQLGLFGGAA
ncbi:MAG TPA: hypothetical protein VHP11_13610 [Tepidisphaeraceae bacterium]|nr:hypothetical protein [Tepidisphaeraceae bacterium]